MAAPFAPVRPPADDHDLVHVADASAPGGGRHRTRSPRRTTLRVIAAIGVTGIVVGGLTFLTIGTDGADRADARGAGQTPATDVPGSTNPPVPAETSATSTDQAPEISVVEAVEAVGPVDVTARLAEIEIARQASLATIERVSFTATVTSTFPGQPDSVQRHDVIVHADGSLWATDPNGGWQSFDPTDGTVRAGWTDEAGSMQFQELSGQTTNHLPLSAGVGVNPPWTQISVAPDAETTIEDIVVDGRPAWHIVSRSTPLAFPPTTAPPASQLDTWTIDQSTGFIVASSTNGAVLDPDGSISGRTESTATLDGLTVGTPLPTVFPGSFPAGASVTRSGDPRTGIVDTGRNEGLTLEEAALAFGPGAVLPSALPTGSMFTVDRWPSDDTTEVFMLVMAPRRGFAAEQTLLFAHKSVLMDATSLTADEIVVGDARCISTDGRTCEATIDGTVIERGAWSGAPSRMEGSSVMAALDGIDLSISGATAEESIALAESLVAFG